MKFSLVLVSICAAFAVSLDAMVHSPGPLAPSPPRLGLDGVAAHAGRHLALLLATDPVVQACAIGGSPLWDLIGRLTPSPAGSPRPERVYSGLRSTEWTKSMTPAM